MTELQDKGRPDELVESLKYINGLEGIDADLMRKGGDVIGFGKMDASLLAKPGDRLV